MEPTTRQSRESTVELLHRIRAGDEEARDTLYLRLFDRLVYWARRRFGAQEWGIEDSIDFSWTVNSSPSDNTVRAFQAAFPSLGSLTSNPNAEAAIRIASSRSYADWLTSKLPDKLLARPETDPIRRACQVIGVACALKCRFFPNPICIGCGVALTACALYTIGCWIFGCD